MLRSLRHFIDWLSSGDARHARAAFLKAAQVREAASKRLSAARFVQDTRRIHEADLAYRAATTEALRAEIAWRRIRPRRPSRAAQRPASIPGSAQQEQGS